MLPKNLLQETNYQAVFFFAGKNGGLKQHTYDMSNMLDRLISESVRPQFTAVTHGSRAKRTICQIPE